MTEELGKIDKPEAGDIGTKRKLYVVPLVYPLPGAPDGYATRLEAYWKAVDEHASGLEARAGIVKRVFHEGISFGGQPGIDQLKQTNLPAFPLINSRVNAGASLEALDDDDMFMEALDWGRILQGGFTSRTVADTVQAAFEKSSEARIAHMAKSLSEKVGDGEAALLIISSTRGIDIPEDIEQFNIMPPELDELSRWIQETARAQEEQLSAAQAQAAAADAGPPGAAPPPPPGAPPPEAPPEEGEGPTLWTPGSP